MRVVMWLSVMVLLAPSALAEPWLYRGGGGAGGDFYNGVVHGDSFDDIKTHQNMAIELEQDGRIWFSSSSLHEHDGVTSFAVGIPGDHQLRFVADGGTYPLNVKAHPQDDLPDGPIHWTAQGSGFNYRSDNWTAAEWVIWGEHGVWLRGWAHQPNVEGGQTVATMAVAETVTGQLRVLGQVQATTLSSPPVEPVVRDVMAAEWDECTPDQVRMDPEQVYVGNPVRLTIGSFLKAYGSGSYRLLSDVEGPTGSIQENVHFEWTSDGPAGETAFRVPHAGTFRLQVENQDIRCELAIDAKATSAEVRIDDDVESSFTMEDGNLVFRTHVLNGGHYEHPVSLAFTNDTTAMTVWAGKLHSHGTPVTFTVPDPLPGTYTVQWDSAPQGPDPIVPAMQESTFTVAGVGMDDEKGAPAPLGVLALLAVALLARRRN